MDYAVAARKQVQESAGGLRPATGRREHGAAVEQFGVRHVDRMRIDRALVSAFKKDMSILDQGIRGTSVV